MAKKKPISDRREGTLHLAIEDEDWIVISGTTGDLERLGEWLIEFARAEGKDSDGLDSPSHLLRADSLGIYLYRRTQAE